MKQIIIVVLLLLLGQDITCELTTSTSQFLDLNDNPLHSTSNLQKEVKIDNINQSTPYNTKATKHRINQLLIAADSLLGLNEFLIADSLLKLVLPLTQETNDIKGQARYWQNTGYIAERWGKMENALADYQTALIYWRRVGDSTGVGKTLRDLSIVKERQGDYATQMEYAKQGYNAVAFISKNGVLRGDLAIDLGNVYTNFGSFTEARAWYEEALRIHMNNQDSLGISRALYGLGNLFYKMDELPYAKQYIQRAIPLFKVQKNISGWAQAQNVLGAIYLKLERYDSASYYLQESLRNATTIPDTLLIYDAYVNLTLNAIYQDDIESAKNYYNKTTELYQSRESLDNQDALEVLEKNGLILETVLAHKQTKFYATLVASLIILLLTLIIGFCFYYLEKKRKTIFQASQRKFEQEQEEAKHAQEIDKLLEQVNQQTAMGREQGEKEERQRLKKLVHNTIGSQLAATKWTIEPYIESSRNHGQEVAELENILKMVEKAFKNSRNIERLLEKDNRNWMQEIEEFFNLLQQSKQGNPKIEFQRHGLDVPLPAGVGRWVSQVIKIIVANVLSHAQARSFNCQMNLMEEELIIIAEDDGKGFYVEEVKKNNDSSGIRNLESIVKSLNGNISIESVIGKGTTTTITIPIEY